MINRMLGMRAVATRIAKSQRLCLSTATKLSGVELISPLVGLTDEQAEYYNVAKQFADKELFPNAAKWEEEHHFPLDTFKQLGDLGFGGMFVRDDVGGSALTRLDTAVIVEALSTGCVGTTAMLTIHNMCAGMIDKFGSDELRNEWLPKLTSLELVASYCLTEPSAGSDAASLQTTAKKEGNEYILNGSKVFISGAGMSDVYVVMARTGGKGPKGVSCFLVPKDAPGVSFGANEKKMGWKVQPTRQIIFDNVKIPATNMVGSEGQGFSMAMAGLDGGRINIGSCSLGAMQQCFSLGIDYTKERKQFGKSISELQMTQFRLADMAAKITQSRLMLRQAASLLDQRSPLATTHCAMAKKVATEHGFDVCNQALQLFGGYGYLQDYHIERYVRDCRVHMILEGTNEIMSHIVGRALVA